MRPFTRQELALIQTALHQQLQSGTVYPYGVEIENIKHLRDEIQSYLLNDPPTSLLTKEFLEQLRNTKSMLEWSKLCQEMLAKNGGEYPSDWFAKVMATGIQEEAYKNWRTP